MFEKYVLEIFERNDVPTDLGIFSTLHWIQKNISNERVLFELAKVFGDIRTYQGMTEREIEKSNEVFEIEDNCSMVLYSYQVNDGRKVYYSSSVEDGISISKSNNIRHSSYVSYGDDVLHSLFVSNSREIRNSKNIEKSSGIYNSNDVVYGTEVRDSTSILRGKNIKNCFALFDSKNCNEVYFSRNMKSCHHCLFCNGLEGKEFYIFNIPVSQKDFFIVLQLVRMAYGEEVEQGVLSTFTSSFEEWCGFRVDKNFYESEVFIKKFYRELSNNFFSVVRKIPTYNDWLLYNLTMNINSLDLEI